MIYVKGNKKLVAKYRGLNRIARIYHGDRLIWNGNDFNKWSYDLKWSYKYSWKYK